MKGNKIDLRNIAWYLFLGLIISEIIIKVSFPGWLWLVPISLFLIHYIFKIK